MSGHNDGNQSNTVQQRLAAFMNHDATEIVVAILILISVALVLWEASVPHDWPHLRTLELTNDALTGIFIVELTLRFFAERRKRRFFQRFWIDIIAVLPLMRGLRVLRVLRLLRLFRLGLIITRRMRLFSGRAAFVRLEYILITFAIFISVLMGGLSMRFAEGRENPDFASLGDALWFALLTVIGGEPIDGAPATELGRVVTAGLMLGGLTVFAIFTGTVSAIMVDSLRSIRLRSMEIEELHNHVVICGWNRAGQLLIDELLHESRYEHFVVVAERADLEDSAFFKQHEHRVFFQHGDFTRMEALRQAGVERAAVAILLADDSKDDRSLQDRDARTVLAAMLIEKINAHIYTTVQLHNRDNESSLRKVGVEEIIVSDDYVGNIMASVVRNRGIVSVLDELLTAKRGHQFFKVPVPRKLVGKPVEEALRTLKHDHDCILIAVDRGGGAHGIIVNPPADLTLQSEHHIIVAGERAPG